MGAKVCANNIIRTFRLYTKEPSMGLNDVHRLLARYDVSPLYKDPKKGPIYDWDDVSLALNAIHWDVESGKFQFKYPKQTSVVTKKEVWPQEDYSAPEEHMDYVSREYANLEEGRKKIVKNDKGEIVPDKCPECGADVGLYIQGEPIYRCSNDKCKKYFGAMPCNLNENITDELKKQRKLVNTNPSDGQKKAGNYAMGHITINGYNITIENPKGSYRSGTDGNGKKWKTLMHNDYGYFTKTKGYDGDAIDVFIGDKLDSKKIFVVDQYYGNNFDESKVMLGFNTSEEAKKAYLSNYSKDWKGFKYITCVDDSTFKKWLYDNKKQRKPFCKYIDIMNKKIDEKQISDIRRKVFLSESQIQYINSKINEGKSPYSTESVLAIKKYLDGNFKRGYIDTMSEDGYPTRIKIVALLNKSGEPIKNMTDVQLFEMLQDKFQHLCDDENKRDNLLKQIIKDWYKDKISKNGMLSVNLV